MLNTSLQKQQLIMPYIARIVGMSSAAPLVLRAVHQHRVPAEWETCVHES